MAKLRDPIFSSKALIKFTLAYQSTTLKEEKDKLWGSLSTPLIEDIPDDNNHKLVTFLYRQKDSTSKKQPSIYLDSSITGLPLSQGSQLIGIPNTDIFQLSLKLPNKLRTTYNFIRLDEQIDVDDKQSDESQLTAYPIPIGKFKKSQQLLGVLFQNDKIEIDTNNKKKIAYFIDFEIQDKSFGMESILELPQAPIQQFVPSSNSLIKEERDKLKLTGRFIESSLNFSESSLKDSKEYKNESRKYWIYLPPEYNSRQQYSLLLFLDGSDFINTIPTPSILDRMIAEGKLPPSIAIFLDYSLERRQAEYYCDEMFTKFLNHDFINKIKDKHQIKISNDANLNTIIGLSASGLAAFYSSLTHPFFGNVIIFSASFESIKQKDIEEMINHNLAKIRDKQFILYAGSYENIPIELQFPDHSKQGFSIYTANQQVFEYLRRQHIQAKFNEFCGGHNYICWRGLLSDGLKEVYNYRG